MQGLDALGYSEHIDYDLVESTNPAFQKAIVRANVFRDHRQVSAQPASPRGRALHSSCALQRKDWAHCGRLCILSLSENVNGASC